MGLLTYEPAENRSFCAGCLADWPCKMVAKCGDRRNKMADTIGSHHGQKTGKFNGKIMRIFSGNDMEGVAKASLAKKQIVGDSKNELSELSEPEKCRFHAEPFFWM